MKKWLSKIFVIALIAVSLACIHPDVDACAKTKHMIVEIFDNKGNMFIEKDGKQMRGWFKIGNKTYYAHKTKSHYFPKGSVCTRTYRIRNGKMYYFDKHGVMVTKNTRKMPNVTFNRNGSVHYIYTLYNPKSRYNANRQRYQIRKRGKWVDVGMQCYPYGMIDWQK